MRNDTLTESELAQFTGTERWFKHSLARDILYTEGAQFVAEKAGAYWLLDEIALAQKGIPAVRAEEFQVWNLTVRENHTATLACEDGNDNVVYSKEIEFSDFPLPHFTFWFANSVIYLPSEH